MLGCCTLLAAIELARFARDWNAVERERQEVKMGEVFGRYPAV